MTNINNKLKGCLWGSIVGDALGGPYEFMDRGSYNPTKEYNQGGTFNLVPGEWTDDTSMSLCAMASFTQNKKFDEDDLMTKWYDWYSKGYMSSRDICFDIGGTTSKSLSLYHETKSLKYGFNHERFSGNGGIMRFSPIAVFTHKMKKSKQEELGEQYSSLTHPSPICKYCAILLMKLIQIIFRHPNYDKTKIMAKLLNSGLTVEMEEIIKGSIEKTYASISAGGFVKDALEAALFAFLKTSTFIDGLYLIISMGDDTDTVGAIYGQIAGAFYGYSSIPSYYIDNLYKKDFLDGIINPFIKSIE
jgi:ADP-ribosyl-[dinitrogen reductase] hydrolase